MTLLMNRSFGNKLSKITHFAKSHNVQRIPHRPPTSLRIHSLFFKFRPIAHSYRLYSTINQFKQDAEGKSIRSKRLTLLDNNVESRNMMLNGAEEKAGGQMDIQNEIPPKYYFRDGLRYVEPYPLNLLTRVKQRWFGRKLIDVLSEEFVRVERDQWISLIKRNRVLINQDSTHPEHILSPSNSISTLLYKIDPPVSAEHIRIVFQDHSVVVVDKPGSIPIHPNARYTHNSLVNILKYDYGISGLFPIHRLDALTTGTIIFARSPTLAKRLQKEMKSRNVVKKYLALVEGDFVRYPVSCELPIGRPLDKEARWKCIVPLSSPASTTLSSQPTISLPSDITSIFNETMDKPFITGNVRLRYEMQDGVVQVQTDLPDADSEDNGNDKTESNDQGDNSEGAKTRVNFKSSQTLIRKLWSKRDHDGRIVSLVECQPITGRTHQIRLHLASLGFPIRSDPIYNPKWNRHGMYAEMGSRYVKSRILVDASDIHDKSENEGTRQRENGKDEELNEKQRLLGIELCAWKYEIPIAGIKRVFEVDLPHWAVK